MDIAMPELNGIDAAQQIHTALPDTRLIILSMHSSAEHVARALQAGADGYLLKESAGAEVVAAVRAVSAGARYLSQRIAGTMMDDYLKRLGPAPPNPLDLLSPREREVLQLVVEGKTSAEIAAILSLSAKTVETYRSRLMAKLRVSSLAELIRFAIQRGITPLE
jgi:DNA-binding NarL/FixJ family response regulator